MNFHGLYAASAIASCVSKTERATWKTKDMYTDKIHSLYIYT